MRDNSRVLALFLFNSCIGIFLTYGLFFNSVSADFNSPPSITSLVFGAYSVLYAVSSFAMGLVMGVRGPGRTILAGGVIMAAGLIASGFANSIWTLLVTFSIGGLGIGASWLPTTYVVFERFHEGKVRRTMGIVSAGTAFGTLLFSPIEGYIITAYGWRAAFFVVGFITLAITTLAYRAARGGAAPGGFDVRDALRKFRSGRFFSLYSYYLVGNAFSRTLVLIFVVPLIESRGLGFYLGSLSLSLIGVGSLAGRLTSGARRFSEEAMAGGAFILQGVSIIGLFLSSDPISISVLSLLFGVGYGAYIPEFPLLIRKYYGTSNYGAVFGALLTSYGIGALLGPFFQGYELTLTGSYTIGFYAAAAGSIAVGLHLVASVVRRASAKAGTENGGAGT